MGADRYDRAVDDAPADPSSPGPRPLPQARPRRGILSEETVHRPDQDPNVENPYWLDEEPAEHPSPELGCIRRGLCCRTNPGWFGPGEVEAAARLLDLEPDAFVRRYAVVTSVEVADSESGEARTVYAFAPVKLGRDRVPLLKPGSVADRLYYQLRSPCVFFGDGGCRIYEARPIECRRYVCTNADEDNLSHQELAQLWLAAERGEQSPSA